MRADAVLRQWLACRLLRYYINTTASRRRSNQPESNMSIQYTNGFNAYAAGYARNANPVAYCLNGVFSAAQARLRDEWFAGWDAAEAAK